MRHSLFLLASTTFAALSAPPATAQIAPTTQLVRCGEDSCLRISGRRDRPSQIVSLNGRELAVEGKRDWRALVSLDTLRKVSKAKARQVDISLRDSETLEVISAPARLPIGLLGDISELSAIEVTAS